MPQQNNHKQQKPKEPLNTYAHFSGLVIQMIAIIAIGTFVGVKLDEKFPNEHNLYTLGFSLTSVIMAIIYTIRRIIAASKKDS